MWYHSIHVLSQHYLALPVSRNELPRVDSSVVARVVNTPTDHDEIVALQLFNDPREFSGIEFGSAYISTSTAFDPLERHWMNWQFDNARLRQLAEQEFSCIASLAECLTDDSTTPRLSRAQVVDAMPKLVYIASEYACTRA